MDALASLSTQAQPDSSAGADSKLKLAYVFALLFLAAYCARPEDWIPGAGSIPFAKIAGILAVITGGISLALGERSAFKFPREILFLGLLFAHLALTVPLSPVWRGGAAQVVFNQFSKVVMMTTVIAVAATTLVRLRRLMFVQAASVVAVVVVALWKNQHISGVFGRLSGVLGGIYENPNDLAFAIALALPFCFMFLLEASNVFKKLAWALAMTAMISGALNTYSRGGLLALVTALMVCLWEYSVRQRRFYLLVVAVLVMFGAVCVGGPAGYGTRVSTILNPDADPTGSAQARRELLRRSLSVTAAHPLFGVGPGNFQVISGNWHETHNTYTQLSAEAGIPALILFLFILRRSFVNLGEVRSLSNHQPRLLLVVGALRASLFGFVVGSLFGSAAYHFFPYFLVGYASALTRIAHASAPREVPRQNMGFPDEICAQQQGAQVAWSG